MRKAEEENDQQSERFWYRALCHKALSDYLEGLVNKLHAYGTVPIGLDQISRLSQGAHWVFVIQSSGVVVVGEIVMTRARACGALIRGSEILMVLHREADRTYWTLPGGGLAPDESFAKAAVREMFEETGLRTRVVRLLWSHSHGEDSNPEECFLMELVDDGLEATLGADPEESHLPSDFRMLQNLA